MRLFLLSFSPAPWKLNWSKRKREKKTRYSPLSCQSAEDARRSEENLFPRLRLIWPPIRPNKKKCVVALLMMRFLSFGDSLIAFVKTTNRKRRLLMTETYLDFFCPEQKERENLFLISHFKHMFTAENCI